MADQEKGQKGQDEQPPEPASGGAGGAIAFGVVLFLLAILATLSFARGRKGRAERGEAVELAAPPRLPPPPIGPPRRGPFPGEAGHWEMGGIMRLARLAPPNLLLYRVEFDTAGTVGDDRPYIERYFLQGRLEYWDEEAQVFWVRNEEPVALRNMWWDVGEESLLQYRVHEWHNEQNWRQEYLNFVIDWNQWDGGPVTPPDSPPPDLRSRHWTVRKLAQLSSLLPDQVWITHADWHFEVSVTTPLGAATGQRLTLHLRSRPEGERDAAAGLEQLLANINEGGDFLLDMVWEGAPAAPRIAVDRSRIRRLGRGQIAQRWTMHYLLPGL